MTKGRIVGGQRQAPRRIAPAKVLKLLYENGSQYSSNDVSQYGTQYGVADQYGNPGYGDTMMNQVQWGGNEDLAFAGMHYPPANYDSMNNQMLVNPMAQELNQL